MFGKNIYRLSIIKSITRDTKIKLENKLKNINKNQAKAIFLDITTNQGSLNQSLEISNMLKIFKTENPTIPLYTFGEDQILGPGIAILTAGDKVFADLNTIFGCYDFVKKGNEYKQFLDDNKISLKFITAGENKFRLNPFEELRENDVVWIKNLLTGWKNILIECVYENRKHVIKNKESFSELFNSTIYYGDEALQNGLIDKIGFLDEVAMEVFPNIPIKKANVKVKFSQILDHYKKSSSFTPGIIYF